MQNDIKISIAAGEALLFLENYSGIVSLDKFEQFLKLTGANIYLIFYLLLSEGLISIKNGSVIDLDRTMNGAGLVINKV